MQKDRIYLVAPNVDDTIKRMCPTVDLTIFHSFLELEEYINTTPAKIKDIIITETALEFNSINMERLRKVYTSEFLQLEGKVIYLYSVKTGSARVNNWLDILGDDNVVAYSGDLSEQHLIGTINGSLRDSDEDEIEEVTIRYRVSEYIKDQQLKKYDSDDNEHYETDEDLLSGIPDVDEVEDFIVMNKKPMTTFNFIGKSDFNRTILAFVSAQYLALSAKTLIMESDVKYHRLTDIVIKSGIDYEFVDIKYMQDDFIGALEIIKKSRKNLIVIGSKKETDYDYNNMISILSDVLKDHIQYLVVEGDFGDTPYKGCYTLVFDDTMSGLVELIDNLLYPLDPMKNVIVGVRQDSWQNHNMSTEQVEDIACELLDMDELVTQTITLTGSTLKKEKEVYDLFSIINRGNQRQA